LNVGSGGGAAAAPAAGGAAGAGAGGEEAAAKEEEKEEGMLFAPATTWEQLTNMDHREGRVRRGHGFRSFRLDWGMGLFSFCISISIGVVVYFIPIMDVFNELILIDSELLLFSVTQISGAVFGLVSKRKQRSDSGSSTILTAWPSITVKQSLRTSIITLFVVSLLDFQAKRRSVSLTQRLPVITYR
jgi:hypothetical protein